MSTRWSTDEDNILRNNYSSTTCEELSNLLPGRSVDAISKRANTLNLKKNNTWTNSEVDILIKLYPQIGGDVSRHIPNHSRDACTDKANRLGIRCYPSRWTEEEDKILKDNYPDKGKDVQKLIPWRSVNACVSRAKALNLKKRVRKSRGCESHWSKEEDTILRKFYPIMGPDVCFKLPKRTRNACAKRARSIGLRKGKY